MWGQCRRHSAHLNPVRVKSYLVEGVWPLVRDDDWCGEWKASNPASISRTQFAPRTDDLPATAASTCQLRCAGAIGTRQCRAVAAAGDD